MIQNIVSPGIWYKEWKAVRFKLMILSVVYGFVSLLLLQNTNSTYYSMGLSNTWLGYGLVITIIGGVLGGVDLIAEEKATGTLSFLLTKPVSRPQIYAAKIGVMLVALFAPFVGVGFLWLSFDMLHGNRPQLDEVLIGFAGVMAIGTFMTCMSCLISIFAATTVRAMLFGLGAMSGLVMTFLGAMAIANGLRWYMGASIKPLTLAAVLIVLGLALGLYRVGRNIFSTKEF